MPWFTWRWKRFAISRKEVAFSSVIDERGEWVPVALNLWWLRTECPDRR
jgi:hypothetical protein